MSDVITGSLFGGGKGGGGFGGSSGVNFDPGPLLEFTAGQNALRTHAKYANFGLGGSTMEAQDINAGNLAADVAAQDQAMKAAQLNSNIGAQNISNLTSLSNLANQNVNTTGENAGFNTPPGGTGTDSSTQTSAFPA